MLFFFGVSLDSFFLRSLTTNNGLFTRETSLKKGIFKIYTVRYDYILYFFKYLNIDYQLFIKILSI